MAKRDLIAEAKKQNDQFWLFPMVILVLFAVLLLADRNRLAILVVIGIAICYILYKNPLGERH